ncbi:juvenile hormone esterase-like [Cochliomyia hominivorax]
MNFLLCYIILNVIFGINERSKAEIITHVCTPTVGCYDGIIENELEETDRYGAFYGIRYAEKAERFQPPVPYKSSKDHIVKKPSFDCLQKNYLVPTRPVSGSEDCLLLNVYTKREENSSDPLQPVMVYIFGGGFFSGTAGPLFTGPNYIIDTNLVVLVTLNYRLGAFGFMATEDGVIPGNLGLKDQNLALHWVQENIEYFGGEKTQVTIFGQSAGAVSAHMHILSPLSTDLFKNVIAMSGNAIVPFAIDVNPDNTTRQTAKYCNITNWDTIPTTELLAELKKIEAHDLLNAGDHLKYWDVDNLVNYRPIIEKPSPHAFLSKDPVEILSTGDYKPVPLMLGRVPNEGGVRVIAIMESATLREQFNKDFNNLMVKFLEFPKKFNESQILNKFEDIMDEYFGGVKELNDQTRQGFMDLVTDRGFFHPLYNTVKLHVKHIDTTTNPIFMYLFDFEGPYTFATLYAGNVTSVNYGVVHCDDLIYTFEAKYLFPPFDKHTKANKAVKCFTQDFTYFAHHGEPRVYNEMTPCNKDTFIKKPGSLCDYVLYINDKRGFLSIEVDNKFDTRRMQFWDTILEIDY